MEWLQVMQASCPVPSQASPTGCSWPHLRCRQSGREYKAIPRIKATTLVTPTSHLRRFGNAHAHQGEIWYRSAIKGPDLSHQEGNARPLFPFAAPDAAPAPVCPPRASQPPHEGTGQSLSTEHKYSFFKSLTKDMLIDFSVRRREGEREEGRERERERSIDVREKHGSVASHTWGLNLQPRHVSQLGTELSTFWFPR